MNPMLLAARTLRTLQQAGLVTTASPPDWDFDKSGLGNESLADLDAVYSKLVTGGWLVLIHPDADTSRSPAGFVSL